MWVGFHGWTWLNQKKSVSTCTHNPSPALFLSRTHGRPVTNHGNDLVWFCLKRHWEYAWSCSTPTTPIVIAFPSFVLLKCIQTLFLLCNYYHFPAVVEKIWRIKNFSLIKLTAAELKHDSAFSSCVVCLEGSCSKKTTISHGNNSATGLCNWATGNWLNETGVTMLAEPLLFQEIGYFLREPKPESN